MQAFIIEDIKTFMNRLFLEDMFDRFYLVEATINTFNSFWIDGRLRKEYFDSDAWDLISENRQVYSRWKDVRSLCSSLIRGKQSPCSFKIILCMSQRQIKTLLLEAGSDIPADMVTGMFLNIHYTDKKLICTTGISLTTFVADKSIEHFWDRKNSDFFRSHEIPFS